VRRKRPTTSTEQVLAMASKGVSLTGSGGRWARGSDAAFDTVAIFLAMYEARMDGARGASINIAVRVQ
jgi:hypothetical protein